MYKIFLTVIFTLTVSIKTFAQQMIPKQKGVVFSYSVFPQSPEKQNYALNVGIISYAKNSSYFFGLAEYGRKYYEHTNYEIPIEMFLLTEDTVFTCGETLCEMSILISKLEVWQAMNR